MRRELRIWLLIHLCITRSCGSVVARICSLFTQPVAALNYNILFIALNETTAISAACLWRCCLRCDMTCLPRVDDEFRPRFHSVVARVRARVVWHPLLRHRFNATRASGGIAPSLAKNSGDESMQLLFDIRIHIRNVCMQRTSEGIKISLRCTWDSKVRQFARLVVVEFRKMKVDDLWRAFRRVLASWGLVLTSGDFFYTGVMRMSQRELRTQLARI